MTKDEAEQLQQEIRDKSFPLSIQRILGDILVLLVEIRDALKERAQQCGK